MSDLRDLLDEIANLRRDLEKVRVAQHNMLRVGPVIESDADKGVRVQFGTDEEPDKSAWTKSADRTGASSYRPKPGEQVMVLAIGGDPRQAIAIPLTHSNAKPDPKKDADETVHHARDGQRHAVKNGEVTDHADKGHTRFVGDEPGQGSGGNVQHELNRQLQGLRAQLTQAVHHISALHDVTSQMRQIAQGRIPELATLIPVLNGDPQSLQKAADGVLSKLDGYIGKTFEQTVAKLTNGMLGNVLGAVQGLASGQLSGLLDQVSSLVDTHGLTDAAASALDEARGLVDSAAGGAADAIAVPLDALGEVFAGTDGEAAFTALRGQLTGALAGISQVAGGLGDLVGAQENLVKGLTRSYRLGGYG